MMGESSRIIVGIGDVEASVRPLRWAAEEARRRGAELHAVHAWQERGDGLVNAETWCRLLTEAAQQTVLASFEITFGEVPQDIVTKIVGCQGSPAAVLTKYADRDDDLLVLGPSRRRRWWPFGGRVVSACAQSANCMVVVLPPAALARTQPVGRLLRELRRDMKRFERSGAADAQR